MHIVVTGGAGFIGSHFVWMLFSELSDCHVTVIDKLTYAANKDYLKGLPEDRFDLVEMDICNPEIMDEIHAADLVFNFAAESHVDNSISNSDPFINTNINGTYNLLKCLKGSQARFVQVGTDEVYGSLERGQADEQYPLVPSSPYSASKAAADLLVQSFVTTHGLNAVITRSTNNYGPRQHIEKFIPSAIMSIIAGRKVKVYDEGKNIRDWIYVTDNCRGILTAALRGANGATYNIGYEQPKELSNLQVLSLLAAEMENRGFSFPGFELVDNARPGHDFRYAVFTDEIRKLHWAALTPIQAGLSLTVDWYLKNFRPVVSGTTSPS